MKDVKLRDPVTSFVCFDIETTGLNPQTDRVIEIGAVKVKDKKVVEYFSELIYPGMKLSPLITNLTGIDDEMLKGADREEQVVQRFIDFTEDYPVIGHNIMFDYSFIKIAAERIQASFDKRGIDTLELCKKLHGNLESRSLESMCRYYNINNERAHRAYQDAKATVMLYVNLCNAFFQDNPKVFEPRQLIYKVKKVQFVTRKQKNYLLDLLKYHNIDIVQPIDNLTQSEASKWIDEIILNHGRMK
ncbi:3'-5' exonuclease [Anaerocolumna sp.]|uniref:3'-5' exonuclease n=1 Tax=Anaerocolumna sp. TaxID=2041569 RepID=UPI0028A7D6D4|nr:3'-5' exonuclease [Anaerocolumna sp.]